MLPLTAPNRGTAPSETEPPSEPAPATTSAGASAGAANASGTHPVSPDPLDELTRRAEAWLFPAKEPEYKDAESARVALDYISARRAREDAAALRSVAALAEARAERWRYVDRGLLVVLLLIALIVGYRATRSDPVPVVAPTVASRDAAVSAAQIRAIVREEVARTTAALPSATNWLVPILLVAGFGALLVPRFYKSAAPAGATTVPVPAPVAVVASGAAVLAGLAATTTAATSLSSAMNNSPWPVIAPFVVTPAVYFLAVLGVGKLGKNPLLWTWLALILSCAMAFAFLVPHDTPRELWLHESWKSLKALPFTNIKFVQAMMGFIVALVGARMAPTLGAKIG